MARHPELIDTGKQPGSVKNCRVSMERMRSILAGRHSDFVPRPRTSRMEEMAEGIAFAHAHQVKVYVTANILAHNYDLDGVREYLTELEEHEAGSTGRTDHRGSGCLYDRRRGCATY